MSETDPGHRVRPTRCLGGYKGAIATADIRDARNCAVRSAQKPIGRAHVPAFWDVMGTERTG